MDKLDYKKAFPDLYMPGKTPVYIEVPPIPFIMVDGRGAPEGTDYQEALQVLYALSFTIKMSKLSGSAPEGYRDYVVPPLEGLWDGIAGGILPDRTTWSWTSLIRQPDFVTPAVFHWACGEVERKKPGLAVSRARLEVYAEGPCVQVLHVGPYNTEQESLDSWRPALRKRAWQTAAVRPGDIMRFISAIPAAQRRTGCAPCCGIRLSGRSRANRRIFSRPEQYT